MDPFSEFIDLSDGDGIGADESPFNFDDFLAENNIPTHVEAMNITQDVETGPNGYRSLVGGYQSCLESVLDVFPDISHDHVQQIYNEQMKAKGSNGQHEDMVAPSLIEKILDGGVYPKERDRIRELKRKRSDKDVDEEEAAKWKYMDLRDDPTEYAKVAYVCSLRIFTPSKLSSRNASHSVPLDPAVVCDVRNFSLLMFCVQEGRVARSIRVCAHQVHP